MSLISRVLRRLGFVRVRDLELVVTWDGRVTHATPANDTEPVELVSPEDVLTPTTTPALPPAATPAPPPTTMVSTEPAPSDPTVVGDDDEWEWRIALARAKAHAEHDATPPSIVVEQSGAWNVPTPTQHTVPRKRLAARGTPPPALPPFSLDDDDDKTIVSAPCPDMLAQLRGEDDPCETPTRPNFLLPEFARRVGRSG